MLRETGARLAEAAGQGYARVSNRRLGLGRRAIKAHRRSVITDIRSLLGSRFGSGGLRLDDPYKQHATVFSIIRSRAKHVAQPVWRIGEEQPDGTRRELTSGPLVDLFRRPNPVMSGKLVLKLTQTWLDLLGECFWIIDRPNVAARPKSIWPWPGGSAWQPVAEKENGIPRKWVLTGDGKRVPYLPHQLIYFHTENPNQPIRGCSPLQAAFTTLQADQLAEEYTLRFFENGAMPGGFMQYPMEMEDEEFKSVLRKFNDRFQGAERAHRWGVLDAGATPIWAPINQKDMEYLNLRKLAKETALEVFSWPEVALGKTNDQTFANASEARRALWEENVIPLLDEHADTIDSQFFRLLEGGDERPGGKLTGWFDTSDVPAMRLVRESKWDTVLKQQAAGVTLKESNRTLRLEIEPQPHWDQVRIPFSVVLSDPATPDSGALPPPEDGEENPPVATEGAFLWEDWVDGFSLTEEEEDAFLVLDESKRLGDRFALEFEQECEARWLVDRRTKQSQERRMRRRLWVGWNGGVIRPSERGMMRELMPYMRAYGNALMASFNKEAKTKSMRSPLWLPPHRQRIVTIEDIDDVLLDRVEWDAELATRMRPIMEASMRLGGAFTEEQLGAWARLDFLSPEVQAFLDKRVTLITEINGTIEKAVARELRAGIAKNETIQELRARISTINTRLADPRRNLMIARTETGSLTNSTRFQMAEGQLDEHDWVSAGDEQTRRDHLDEDEASIREPTRIGSPFPITRLLHCNDPAGEPGQTINCFLPGTEVEGAFVAGSKAAYTGPAWEIETRRGHRLRVTPNHPVLTLQGWRPAHALRQGDHLLSRGENVERAALRDVNDQHGVALVEDVFETLASDGRRSATVAGARDFHGDGVGIHGEIEVVRATGGLLADLESGSGDGHGESIFVPAAPRLREFHSAGSSTLGRERVAAAAAGLPGGADLSLDGAAVATAPLDALRLGTAAEWDVPASEQAKDAHAADPRLFRQLIRRSAGAVCTDEIVGVWRIEWSGHVYDLQTEMGWLLSNDIVAGNCRCLNNLIPRRNRAARIRTVAEVDRRGEMAESLAEMGAASTQRAVELALGSQGTNGSH